MPLITLGTAEIMAIIAAEEAAAATAAIAAEAAAEAAVNEAAAQEVAKQTAAEAAKQAAAESAKQGILQAGAGVDVNAGLSQGITSATPPGAPLPPATPLTPAGALPPAGAPPPPPPANVPIDPFGGFPSSGPPPPPAGPESAANVINQAIEPPPNPFMNAYEGASKFATEHPYYTGAGIYGTLAATGALENKGDAPPPKRTFNNPYHFSSDFQGTHPNPNDYQYTPKYPSYAMGGIAGIPPQTNFANPSSYEQGTSQYSMATDPMSGNIANRMADGGVTGSGQMQLNVPLSVGGAGGGGGSSIGGGGGYGNYDGTGGPGASLNGYDNSTFGPNVNNFNGGGGYAPPGGPKAGVTYGAPPMQRGIGGKGSMTGPQMDYGMVNRDPAQSPLSGEQLMEAQSRGMARGGIANVPKYSRGRQVDVYDASLRFADMMDNPNRYTPPDTRFQSVDTFRDTNPNTANKLADEASETRRKAIEQRSYVNTGAKYLPASRRPGQLDLGPVGGERGKYDNQESILAAQGGIMGYNLGGYANGGNPRLLRGPGDGMSDNIPATIANRQPARLADGEFVIPADVVSHLGNGSTEAGAKKLHEMMNSVRQARTGNPKQGKKINPSKFMPKK
jgi:hypothetical protein